MDYGALLTKLISFTTLVGNIIILGVLFSHFFFRPQLKKLMDYLALQALPFGFLLSAGATIGSMVYAQVTGYPACILCWTQRIFMFPMMFLFALAWWRRDRGIMPYALMLTALGGAVALYQWVKDMLSLYSHVSLGCPVVPGVPSCDAIYILEFGYITIPMFALNIFILIAIVAYASLRGSKNQNEQ